ncbi:MAG: DUF2497 domain-containing protein [Sphingomonadales bacterium]|nr:DUF2497 domain-containing protein [Sphingomonadales bacterium]
MEDILASIKKIIAEDGDAVASPRPFRKEGPARAAAPRRDDVLDLTTRAMDEAEPQVAPIVSAEAVSASRHALEALNSAVSTPAPVLPARGASVEDLASELLRPMLKDWLDAHLPEIVERLVAKEVARITGRA